MRSAYSAQSTHLVGIYLLYDLNRAMPEIVGGLYKDDIIRKPTARQRDIYKKKIHSFFNPYGLNIMISREHTCIDYSDATLELTGGTFKRYHKIMRILSILVHLVIIHSLLKMCYFMISLR